MSTILFTHSYFYKMDAKQWRFKQPYPPLATILAAAVMREQGHYVELFDTNLLDGPSSIHAKLAKVQPHYLVIYDDAFNYLSKMCLTVMRDAAFAMAEAARQHGCTVIVSSSDSTDHFEKYLDRGAHYVIRGEGEESLKDLIHALDNEKNPSTVAGIAFRHNGETLVTPNRPVMRDLDRLPMPAWDLVDVESYRQVWQKHHGYFSLNIATTRGCPFKCNWCAKPIYGNRYNSRSPEHVVAEIKWLLNKFKPDHFWMCDDIFGLKPGWVQAFNEAVQKEALHFRFKIQSRADLLLEADTIDALVRAGIDTVWVGAESGSQEILDAMDKGTTVGQIYDATRLLKEKGVKVAFFLQFGYLGETQADIDKTINMVKDLMPDEVGISVSYPLPGTKFYEKVRDQLREKQNWTDSDDLAMMFQGTFPPDYYRVLHRYVHGVYRKQRGYAMIKKLFSDPLRLSYKDIRAGLVAAYYLPYSIAQLKKLKKLEASVS